MPDKVLPRRIFVCAVLLAAFAGPALAQYPQPHAGWKLVPGGEDLIAKGYWGSVLYWTPPPAGSTFSVSNGVLNATAGTGGYFGSADPVGPWLYTSGDFGATATIQTGPNLGGMVALKSSLMTGAQYWQGLKQVEFGVTTNGDYVFFYYDGSTASPVSYRTLRTGSGQPPVGQVTMEFLRQNGQFLVFFNGAQYGPFPDPGIFTTNYVMPGFQVSPGQQINITQFALEVPKNDTGAQIIQPVGAIPFTHAGESLGSLAAAAGRTFGVEVEAPQLATGLFNAYTASDSGAPDRTLSAKVIGEFASLSHFVAGFSTSEPVRGQFVFDAGDALIATARATGRAPVFCHGLIGGANGYSPDWVVHGNFSKAELTDILQTHIRTVVSHYRGQCESWTVLNEVVASDGSLRTDNVWAQTIGPSFVDLAFQAAREADPDAKLYLVDYAAENSNAKANGVYKLASGLKQRGVPIDGVGMQGHWVPFNGNPDYTPNHDQIVANMSRLAALGLLVRITELDVALKMPATAADFATQATAFAATVQACLDSPNCVGINVFGVHDAMSWIPAVFPGEGAATMFDASFRPKPAYTAVMNALRAAPKAKSAITSVHTASGGTDIAQNTFIEIKGVNLVPATTPAAGVIWSNAPEFASGRMPAQLEGVSVTVNGKPAFVYFYCSAASSPVCVADQINVLTPLDNTTGPVQIVVTSGSNSTAPFTANMKAAAPTFLVFNALGPVVATHADYSLMAASTLYPGYSTPAKPGETVLIYAVGFGLPTNVLVNGSSSQSGLLPTVPVCQVAGLPAKVSAALVGPGLYQLNLTIPAGVSNGDNPVGCTYNGEATPPGSYVTVRTPE